MSGFWRGVMAGGMIAAAMSMYMNEDKKRRRNFMGPRRRKQTVRMLRGASRTFRELMR